MRYRNNPLLKLVDIYKNGYESNDMEFGHVLTSMSIVNSAYSQSLYALCFMNIRYIRFDQSLSIAFPGSTSIVSLKFLQYVADKPMRRAASRRTCWKQVIWTSSVINVRPSSADNASRRKSPIVSYCICI